MVKFSIFLGTSYFLQNYIVFRKIYFWGKYIYFLWKCIYFWGDLFFVEILEGKRIWKEGRFGRKKGGFGKRTSCPCFSKSAPIANNGLVSEKNTLFFLLDQSLIFVTLFLR